MEIVKRRTLRLEGEGGYNFVSLTPTLASKCLLGGWGHRPQVRYRPHCIYIFRRNTHVSVGVGNEFSQNGEQPHKSWRVACKDHDSGGFVGRNTSGVNISMFQVWLRKKSHKKNLISVVADVCSSASTDENRDPPFWSTLHPW